MPGIGFEWGSTELLYDEKLNRTKLRFILWIDGHRYDEISKRYVRMTEEEAIQHCYNNYEEMRKAFPEFLFSRTDADFVEKEEDGFKQTVKGIYVTVEFVQVNPLSLVEKSKGKVIKELHIQNNVFYIVFEENILYLVDNNQQCCESRYFHTDDVLSDFVGSIFVGVRIQDGEGESPGGDTKFLLIDTSIGTFTVVAYNDHNGSYSGTNITVEYGENL